MRDERSYTKRLRTLRNKTKHSDRQRHQTVKKSDRGKPWAKES